MNAMKKKLKRLLSVEEAAVVVFFEYKNTTHNQNREYKQYVSNVVRADCRLKITQVNNSSNTSACQRILNKSTIQLSILIAKIP